MGREYASIEFIFVGCFPQSKRIEVYKTVADVRGEQGWVETDKSCKMQRLISDDDRRED